MRHSHQKSKTLADKSFKAAACWVTGTVVCCLCSSASTIYLYSCSEADWGCPFQIRLSLFIPVATASVMVSHFLTFISFHWPPPPHDTHFFWSEMLSPAHGSPLLQPCRSGSHSPYHFPFPAALHAAKYTKRCAGSRRDVPLAGAQLHLFASPANRWLFNKKKKTKEGLEVLKANGQQGPTSLMSGNHTWGWVTQPGCCYL